MTEVADPLEALVEFVSADSTIASLCGSRVYGDEINDDESDTWPPSVASKSILLTTAGGSGMLMAGSRVQVSSLRIDARCLGENPKEAAQVHWALHGLLKYMGKYEASNGVILHNATREGGPYGLREPDTNWAYKLSTWVVNFAEVAAA